MVTLLGREVWCQLVEQLPICQASQRGGGIEHWPPGFHELPETLVLADVLIDLLGGESHVDRQFPGERPSH